MDKFEQGYAKALDDFGKIIYELNHKRGCPYCGIPLLESHLCRRCNERVSVEMDYDGLIEYLRKEIAKLEKK